MTEKGARQIKLLAAMSEEQLATRYKRLAKKVSLTRWLCLPPHMFLLSVAILVYLSAISLMVLGLKQYYIHMLAVSVFAGFGLFFIHTTAVNWAKQYINLTPVAETPDLCAACLDLTNGDEDARAWRDNAITKGRQLRGFDYDMMYSLHKAKRDAEYALQAEDAAQRELEKTRATCAALHSVAN